MKPFIDAIKRQHDDVLENAKLRQEFTANVSHELKTPLTAISGYSELIENGMVIDEGEIRRFCGEIHKSAGRLLTLINDVIRLSELDDSENSEILEPINLLDSARAFWSFTARTSSSTAWRTCSSTAAPTSTT